MAKLKIAQVGCGGMGLRHVYGQSELRRQGFDTFDLVALCDLHASAAGHLAGEAEKGMGKRPKVYTSFDEMLEREKGLDAVDIVTDIASHHVFALKAFDAGVHVAVEKPMGLTVRACRKMIEAANRAGMVLLVSENHRRDPVNRLVKAILDSEALGGPRLAISDSISGTRLIPHTTAWRHIKTSGGYLLDYGVHEADLLLYFMGEVDTVYAETHLWEKMRYPTENPSSASLARWYGHRVKEEIELGETIECTSEDMSLGLMRFRSGAIGQFGKSIAAPGQSTHADIIYCGEGSLKLPGSRSGRPTVVTRMGEQAPLAEQEVLDLVPGFQLDDLTSSVFGGQRTISSYDFPYEQTDGKFIAMGLQDFANAIIEGGRPEVTGEVGRDAVALTYAFLESGHVRQPVSFADVVEDRVNAYQQEINESAGL